MKLDCALLCDAVTVREGLLHVLGGGITRVTNVTYPAEFVGALAMRILLHQTEAGADHSLQVILQTEDGDRLVEMTGGFRTELPPDLAPGEDLPIPMAMAFQGPLPSPGSYSFELLIDNVHQVTVPLRAVTPE
jgi:hypothetical protein